MASDEGDQAIEAVMAKIHVTQQGMKDAIEVALSFGDIDGAHHKMWVIDQMTRKLAGEHYEELVAAACLGEAGPDTYEWDEGIAP